ncbi:MAG: Lytic transglycosylase, catalytic [Rhodocyclaceae bacterium]|nr:Lytic transglycosylase, catalytic [Rhodocyclaceae bacterium]
MRWRVVLLTSLLVLLLPACEQQPLPFPTPAQSDLVVLVQDGPLTYTADDTDKVIGLEHDLIEAFAQDLGVEVRYQVVPPEQTKAKLAAGKAHFAASWFSPDHNDGQQTSPPFLHSSDVLVQNEASLPIDELAELKGRTVHVMPGSRQAAAMAAIQASVPELQVAEYRAGTVFDLLQAVGDREVELALVDSALLDIAQQFLPAIQPTLIVGDPRPIAWLFGEKPNSELFARAQAFIERVQKDGTLARLEDRYLGHVHRLRPDDVGKFIERIETVLPKLRRHFYAAQASSGLDWRLLAAVAYHESQWDPNAVSPTGVRGIMMLTEETADRLGVSNRLDIRESILGGARYLDYLKNQLPSSAQEPDRTWLALAAYNIGPGHFNAARTLAKQLKADPDSWYEMKRILPLLAQPRYYEKLKAGRARGGEAVILAENIRSYYDILTRHEEPYRGTPSLSPQMLEMAGLAAGREPGLKR